MNIRTDHANFAWNQQVAFDEGYRDARLSLGNTLGNNSDKINTHCREAYMEGFNRFYEILGDL